MPSPSTLEAMQRREASQRQGLLEVKNSIAAAHAAGQSFAAFKEAYRPVGVDGKLKELWAEVTGQIGSITRDNRLGVPLQARGEEAAAEGEVSPAAVLRPPKAPPPTPKSDVDFLKQIGHSLGGAEGGQAGSPPEAPPASPKEEDVEVLRRLGF
mmetsp:Transcript_31086/g.101579  ORF Transcript_31086/g.101579 Transcript_31086/m.101579 type:complete len:154 (-) Transcript_31086:469-930(-)